MGYRPHRRDKCKIGTPGSVTPPNPNAAFTWGDEIRCRFEKQAAGEAQTSEAAQLAGTFFLHPDETVTVRSRIHLTRYRLTALESDPDADAAEIYAVVGPPKETLGELVVPVQRVHQGSAA